MPIVYPKDVALAHGLSKIGFVGRFIDRILMWFLRLHKINTIYDRCVANSDEAHFTSSLLYQFRANYHISPSELKRIPTKGPVVLVSNHALGGLDGIMLIHFLQDVRPDFKLMANFILRKDPSSALLFSPGVTPNAPAAASSSFVTKVNLPVTGA